MRADIAGAASDQHGRLRVSSHGGIRPFRRPRSKRLRLLRRAL
jgi:hypothetical protein